MPPRRITLALLTLVLAFTALGCEPAPPEALTNPEATEAHDESAEQAESMDPAILEGRWSVATTLTDVDNDAFWFLGDEKVAQWEITVDGAVMEMQTVDNRYSGVVKSNGDDWVYEGLAEYSDEDGYAWTNTIVVRATQNGDGGFIGTMEQSTDSDTAGHMVTGTWEIVGERL